MIMPENDNNEDFELYDLRVEVVASDNGKPMICRHELGDYFTLTDDDLLFFPQNKGFPLYSLAALLPLLPARQRELNPNDWMFTDAVIACPDPHCGGRFKITREQKRTYKHSEYSAVPLTKNA
jgi:uncharacterized repeat protein (TIGR04076 family)